MSVVNHCLEFECTAGTGQESNQKEWRLEESELNYWVRVSAKLQALVYDIPPLEEDAGKR